MKKSFLFVLLAITIVNAQAQNYLINFTGSGASSSVDSVMVENLTQSSSIKLGGGDALQLLANVGINEFTIHDSQLAIYPNPMTESGYIEFKAPTTGNTSIEIFDITGKMIIQTIGMIQQGMHIYNISGIRNGIYTVRIKSETYSYTGKLISNYLGTATANINYQSHFTTKTVINNNKKLGQSNVHQSKGNTIQMQYHDGDTLKAIGISGNFGTVKIFIPTQSETITFPFYECTDAENNNYLVVEITTTKKTSKGSQIWMAENLNVGTMINGTSSQANNGIIEKYCYDNDPKNCLTYGGLYQWDELMNYTGNLQSQGICPVGWHVPSNDEWAVLINTYGGVSVAATHLREAGTAHWLTNNSTNYSGFTALPAGTRDSWDGTFWNLQANTVFWTSTAIDATNAAALHIHHLDGNEAFSDNRADGYSLRCLKN